MDLLSVQSYLERIGIKDAASPSLKFLTELQHKHLLSVPFEDLDIPVKRIELDINKFYKKIILNKRGGFCYELNGLFHWLLTSLGFKAHILSARVFNSSKNEYGPEYDHMALLVHLDNGKEYLVDVGFGDTFRVPIPLPEGAVHDVSGYYRLINPEQNIYELQKLIDDKWNAEYRFSAAPRILPDFTEMCYYQQDNPGSHFRTRMLCTIAAEKGRITLSNDSLTITENGRKEKIHFEKEDDFHFYLKKYFGIELY